MNHKSLYSQLWVLETSSIRVHCITSTFVLCGEPQTQLSKMMPWEMHQFLLSPSALGKKKGQRERKEKLMTNEHEP